MQEQKKKPKKKIWTVVFIVCLVVLIAAAAAIAVTFVKQKNRENYYETLAEAVIETTGEEKTEETTEEETTAAVEVSIELDFEALWEVNEDIYAWIYIADTVISYPIVQKEGDNNYYLNRTVDGQSGRPGSIFTQSGYNSTDMQDNVTIIYGHNMSSGTMFGTLSEYQDEEYREEHSIIEIYTPDSKLTYELVCAVTYSDVLIPYAYDLDTEEGYAEFLESLTTSRYIPTWLCDDFEERVTTDDRVIILSTCGSDTSKRYLVGAVLVSEEAVEW